MTEYQKVKKFNTLSFLKVGLGVGALVLLLAMVDVLNLVKVRWLNILYKSQTLEELPKDIVFIVADEKTTKDLSINYEEEFSEIEFKLDLWRKADAKLLKKLMAANPKVIAFDSYFQYRSDYDSSLIQAIKETTGKGIQVIVASEMLEDGSSIRSQYSSFQNLINSNIIRCGYAGILLEQQGGTVYAVNLIKKRNKLPLFDQNSKRKLYSHFSSFALKIAESEIKNIYCYEDEIEGIKYGKTFKIPLNEPDGFFLINFFRTNSQRYGYREIYQYMDTKDGSTRLKEIFNNKYVIIGSKVAEGFKDNYLTPVGRKYGYEIHADILGTILSQKFIQQTNNFINYFIIFLLSLIMGLIHLIEIGSRRWIIVFIILLILFTSSFILFSWYNVWFDIVYPFGGAFLTYIVVAFHKRNLKIYRLTGLSRKNLKRFEQDNLIRRLGIKDVTVSILYSDIRGFTNWSNLQTLSHISKLINEYISEMENIIYEHNGFVNKYMGDAIVGFWCFPYGYEEKHKNAQGAIKCAFKMIEKLDELVDKWQKEFDDEEKLFNKNGIGIATGDIRIGYFGGRQKLQIDALGGPFNLAQRLENTTKDLKVKIVVDESTYNQIHEIVEIREHSEDVEIPGLNSQKIYIPEELKVKQ